MQPTVRLATVADAQAASHISTQNFTESFGASYAPDDLAQFLANNYSVDRHAAWIADSRYALFLLEHGGELLGHALVGPCGLPHAEVKPGDGELKRMYVLAKAHGGGLGAQLMDAALAWLTKAGPRTLWLGVWSENFGAQKFYRRYGFERAGEYYFEVGATRDFEFIFKREATG